MAVLRDALQKNPKLKLILMSATLDSELFLSYFDKSCHIQVPGRMFPVDEVYLEDILLQMDYKLQNKVFQSAFSLSICLFINCYLQHVHWFFK